MATNRSAIFAAAHSFARIARRNPLDPRTYRALFVIGLRVARIDARAAQQKAALAAEPQVLITLALTYQMGRERAAAKKEGFTYSGATQTWSKLTKRSTVPACLLAFVVEGAAPAARPERAPAYATRAQRRHFEAEQGIFGASVSWGDCFAN